MKVARHAPEETLALLSLLGISLEKWKVLRSIVISVLLTIVATAAMTVEGGGVNTDQVVVVTIGALLTIGGVESVEIPLLRTIANERRKNETEDDDGSE